jgi:hypothetical protein
MMEEIETLKQWLPKEGASPTQEYTKHICFSNMILKASKTIPKWNQHHSKMDPKCPKCHPNDPQKGPQMLPGGLQMDQKPSRRFKRCQDGLEEVPGSPQEFADGAKRTQDAPPKDPRCPLEGPRWPLKDPRWPKEDPRWPLKDPRSSQDGPKMLQKEAKMDDKIELSMFFRI